MKRVSFEIPDGTLSALRFGPEDEPVRLVFCHANGFNARTYRAVLKPLGVAAIALDLRGHGQTDLPADPEGLADWQIFANDIAAFFERHIDQPVVLAGHSYGAVSSILSLPSTRDKVSGYCGFDPVLVPRLFSLISRTSLGRTYMRERLPIARKAAQRRAVFSSIEAAVNRYSGRGAFRGISDEVLSDYLIGGTHAFEDGQIRLSCDPLWEQAIFCAQGHNVFKAAPHLPDNSVIVFAGGFGRVSTARQRKRLQRTQPRIDVRLETSRAHLFPLQDPDFARSVLEEVLARP